MNMAWLNHRGTEAQRTPDVDTALLAVFSVSLCLCGEGCL
jgi:hypothetical protein